MTPVASPAHRARLAFLALAVLFVFCFLAAILARQTFAAYARQAAAQESLHWAADVPLLQCDGLPCIEARINGAPVGTLAYTAFKDRGLQFDFHAHRLRVSDAISSPLPCQGACDSFSLITFGKHGPPIVVAKGFTINGRAVTAQIDSLYAGSLLVYDASTEKLGLATEAAAATQIRNFPFTDGGVKMKFVPARDEAFQQISLASPGSAVYFPTPGVHQPDALFDATVGVELFRESILTLDFHNLTVSVRKG